MSERLYDQDLDHAPAPRTLLSRSEQTLQEAGRLVQEAPRRLRRVPGQQQPGERDVLELAQVAEIVLAGQTSFPSPAQRFTQRALGDQHPCSHRRDRTDVRVEVTHVQPLRLGEEVEGGVQIPFRLTDPRHRDPPAIPVLREAGVLAQFLARQQMLPGGIEIIAFDQDLADAHVRVRGPSHRGWGVVGRQLQSPLVAGHRLPETPLGDPDVGQDDRAADHVREVAGLLQTGRGIGVPAVRGSEIRVRPRGESQQGGCRTPRDMIILADQVQRAPGMSHGAGHVAEDPGLAGTVDGDRRREGAKLLLVRDHHLR